MLRIRGCGLLIGVLMLCGSAGSGTAQAASTTRADAGVNQVANHVKRHRKPSRPQPHKRRKAPKHGRQQ